MTEQSPWWVARRDPPGLGSDPRPCNFCRHRRDDHLAWVRYDEEGRPNQAGPCRACFPCFDNPTFAARVEGDR